jgi:hypothetical protein
LCQDLNECPSSGSGWDIRFRQAACWFRRGAERRTMQQPAHPPRYCSPFAARAQQLYLSTVPRVSRAALTSFITICNLDVFVKVFTGDVDPWTGSLRPRPFVKRWIFPGLLLQLIRTYRSDRSPHDSALPQSLSFFRASPVNPQVELTSSYLARALSAVVQHGP